MEDYIALSTLNDFIFCPYSIYLHNIYMGADEDVYHATPQTKGKTAHIKVDNKTTSCGTNDIVALPVFSDELGIMGKIDVYKKQEKWLIERKYELKQIFRGQLYQIWGQYFCMTEMGYAIEKMSFYEISTNRMIAIEIPNKFNKDELSKFIEMFKTYDPTQKIHINTNKCKHCIYCNLCDKIDLENVYT